MFPLEEVRAFGRGAENRDALCRAAAALGLRAIASPTAREAVAGADLIVTSVTLSFSLEPFLDAGWLKPGAFASITDFAAPWVRESLTAFDRIFIDDLEQESAMAKPLVRRDLIAGDLDGLVNGEQPGRTRDDERIAFAFRGLALGDLALAGLAYERARRTG
jgi:ornithine cyclodeaminase/alanine dehydrogenase